MKDSTHYPFCIEKSYVCNKTKGMRTHHYHDNFEIYYLESGICNYFLDNKIYKLSDGDIIFIPRGVIHKTVYPKNEHNRILINFTKDYINPVLAADLQYAFSKRVYRSPNAEKIKGILDKIYDEYTLASKLSNELIRCYMTELFAYIIRNPSLKGSISDNGSGSAIIEDATEYISKNFKEDISLGKLAQRAGYCESYFSKLFKSKTGFGCKEYILTVRIRAAKMLLASTRLSVSDIAYKCGFGDSNYFSTIFKKTEGMSPLKYRAFYLKEKN